MLNSKLSKLKNGVSLLLVTLVLSACSGGGVEVVSQFSNTQDIKEGSAVYLEGQVVGEVLDVTNKGQGSRVLINFDKEAAAKISTKSAVVVNRLKEGAPLEVYNRPSSTGEFLQDGQEIKALDSMFQLGAWMVGDAIQLGTGSVSEYINSFQNYLEGDKFQQDKELVTNQINAATQAAQLAVQEAEKGVSAAMQEMADSEQEMAAAVEQLGEELAPMVEELGNSGAQLMEELQKFTEGLQNTDTDQQQTGKALMDSLLQTLEKLNQSIEQSVQDDDSADSASSQ